MTRILHVITDLCDGGAEAVLLRLVSDDEHNLHRVISLTEEGRGAVKLRAVGVATDSLNMPRGRLRLSGLVKLYRAINNDKPDVVQTWLPHSDLIGGVVARIAGVSSIVWGLHLTDLEPGKARMSTRVVVRLCGLLSNWVPCRIVSCSEGGVELHGKLGYRRDKMRVITNGYDLNVFYPDETARQRVRNQWDVRPDTVLIGMVARWNAQKDHGNLIQALSALKQRYGGAFQCVLVGPGMDESNDKLAGWLEASGLVNDVVLTGSRDDIPAVMNALDVHVLSSAYGEAFPNVVCESMACGVPNVVTNVGDSAVIVGDVGWVVAPLDPMALAGALGQALQLCRSEKYVAWKGACRARVKTNFGIGAMCRAYNDVWDEVAARN